MMHVWTECMPNHNGLGDGMNKSSMRDFITPEERLRNLKIARFNWYEATAIVLFIVAIGSLASWH